MTQGALLAGTALRTLVVDDSWRSAVDVLSLRLRSADGAALPPWDPGAHVELHLPSGAVRHYSLCGDPSDAFSYELAVLREQHGRGGSLEVHERLTVGTTIGVRGPRNHFRLVDDAEHHLLVAGGIGITPILAMARELARRRGSWSAFYGGRSLASMAYRRELAAVDPSRVTLVPQDSQGLLDLPRILDASPPGTVVYGCGPTPLLDAVAEACVQRRQVRALVVERFVPREGAPEKPSASVSAWEGAACTIELARAGGSVDLNAGESVLDAVLRRVPDQPFSCREGYCGTCETGIVEGVVEHRDTLLSDAERAAGQTMMLCVSRPRSARLVLDV